MIRTKLRKDAPFFARQHASRKAVSLVVIWLRH